MIGERVALERGTGAVRNDGHLVLGANCDNELAGGRKGVSAWAVGCCLEEGALLEMFYLHFFGGLGESNGVGHALCVVGCVLAVVLPLGSLDDEALCARRPKHFPCELSNAPVC